MFLQQQKSNQLLLQHFTWVSEVFLEDFFFFAGGDKSKDDLFVAPFIFFLKQISKFNKKIFDLYTYTS